MFGSGKAPELCRCSLCLALGRLQRGGHHPQLPSEFRAHLTGKVRELHSEILDRLESLGIDPNLCLPVAAGGEGVPTPVGEGENQGSAAPPPSGLEAVKTEEPDFEEEPVATVKPLEETKDDKAELEAEDEDESEAEELKTEEKESKESVKEKSAEKKKDPVAVKEKKKSKKDKKEKKANKGISEDPKEKRKEIEDKKREATSVSRPKSGRARSSGEKKKVEGKEKKRDRKSSRHSSGSRRSEPAHSGGSARRDKELKRRRESREKSEEPREESLRLEENPGHLRPRSPDQPPPHYLRNRYHEDWGQGSSGHSSQWYGGGPPGYWGGHQRWSKSKGRERRERWTDIQTFGPSDERKKRREENR